MENVKGFETSDTRWYTYIVHVNWFISKWLDITFETEVSWLYLIKGLSIMLTENEKNRDGRRTIIFLSFTLFIHRTFILVMFDNVTCIYQHVGQRQRAYILFGCMIKTDGYQQDLLKFLYGTCMWDAGWKLESHIFRHYCTCMWGAATPTRWDQDKRSACWTVHYGYNNRAYYYTLKIRLVLHVHWSTLYRSKLIWL